MKPKLTIGNGNVIPAPLTLSIPLLGLHARLIEHGHFDTSCVLFGKGSTEICVLRTFVQQSCNVSVYRQSMMRSIYPYFCSYLYVTPCQWIPEERSACSMDSRPLGSIVPISPAEFVSRRKACMLLCLPCVVIQMTGCVVCVELHCHRNRPCSVAAFVRTACERSGRSRSICDDQL
jgi:hypothetical protein